MDTCDIYDAKDVFVSGNNAYVADGMSGLRIFDISDPESPSLTGTYDFEDRDWASANAVFVDGDYAYIAFNDIDECETGLEVIDISDPSAPTPTGHKTFFSCTPDSEDVFVSGDTAYVASMYVGLRRIDVSNPSSPSLTGTYDTNGVARGVAVISNLAYVADGDNGLEIINLSTMSRVGGYNTAGSASDVAVSGNYAYVADGSAGLQIIDVSTPSSPSLEATYDTSGTAYGVNLAVTDLGDPPEDGIYRGFRLRSSLGVQPGALAPGIRNHATFRPEGAGQRRAAPPPYMF